MKDAMWHQIHQLAESVSYTHLPIERITLQKNPPRLAYAIGAHESGFNPPGGAVHM